MRVFVLALLMGLGARPAFALQGNDNCHDPSTIIKDGNKYWIFTTGIGIYAMYSTDLVNWQSGPAPVFAAGSYPSWISSKVPGFTGDFWAPECIYRNGKFYLYYSVSTFGSNTSTIGVATNVTLDPSNPNYAWVDQGEVISSNSSTQYNCIDPALVTDAGGQVWMTFGSFFKGIGLIQINGTTGKRSGTSFNWIAGNVSGSTRNNSGSEAPYIVRSGSYYYLFLNKGACCQGASSTYYVVVGRSTSVTGPYVDKSGVALENNGGSTLISTSGNYVGPGCVGLYQENGYNFLSHHYYDANDNGRARLCVGNLGWDASSWPFITRDWVASGKYTIANLNSGLIWDSWGCTGVSGQAIAQGTAAGLNCQKWNLVPVGNGEYRINANVGSGLSPQISGCSSANGATLLLGSYSGTNCQRFKIERTNTGALVFASVNGNRVVEVPACVNTAGTTLALYDYLGNNCQKWTVTSTAREGELEEMAETSIVYPNPATTSGFSIRLPQSAGEGVASITVTDMQGRLVHTTHAGLQPSMQVPVSLVPGLYQVSIALPSGVRHTARLQVQ